jgi:hypothetical protein
MLCIPALDNGLGALGVHYPYTWWLSNISNLQQIDQ